MSSEQEIRDLCAKVVAANDLEQFRAALSKLKSAVREHVVEMENKGIHQILQMGKALVEIKEGGEE